jgi:hypothetical protein
MNPWVLVVVIGAGLLLLAILAVWAVGSSLPVGHRAASSACIRGSRDDVWQALVRVEDYPAWRPDVQAVQRLSEAGDRDAWRETGRFGAIEFHVAHAEVGKILVGEVSPEERSYAGSWTYRLADCPGGTLVTVTEDGEIYNPFFRFMSRYVFGYHKSQEEFLRALGAKFGAEPPITRLP